MSSFSIRNIRELPSDPLAKFTNELSKKLSRFLTKDQLDLLDDREDIYTDGQDFDSVVRLHSDLGAETKFLFDKPYYPPTEPDNNKLRLWIRGVAMGNTLRDLSARNLNPTPEIWGDPLIVDGSPHDDGIKTSGVKSIALRFNRPHEPEQIHDEFITIEHDNDTRVSEDLSTGISFFMRFRVFALDEQNGEERTLWEKTDNDPVTDGMQIRINPSGRLKFHIVNTGVEYNVQTATGTIALDTVYDVWCTYAKSGNVQHIYVNNIDKSLVASDSPDFHGDADNLDHTIMSIGQGTPAGNVYGDLYDFREYREKVVSATEVGRMWTNKWTIADIPYGQVMIANYWATYPETPLAESFTSTSFTSTSFTT